MNYTQRMSGEVTAGVLIGALCLTGILYVLYRTEDRAVAMMFPVVPAQIESLDDYR